MAKSAIKARVLVAFELNGVAYHPDQLIELDQSLAKTLDGQIDADPSAVKYCIDHGAVVTKTA